MLKVFAVYKKQNIKRINKRKENEKIDVKGSLEKCYTTVPSQYFDEEFHFNFEYLTSQKDRVIKVQEDVITEQDIHNDFRLLGIWIWSNITYIFI